MAYYDYYEERRNLTGTRNNLRQVNSPSTFGTFISNTCCGLLNGVSALIIIVILNIIPIFMIVIGVYNREKCPADSRIPNWMIVVGICIITITVIIFITNFLNSKISSHRLPLSALTLLQVLISIFSIVWIIIGSVWVYSIYPTVSYNPILGRSNYCDQLTYLFAFINITILYAYCILVCVTILCYGCYSCFFAKNENNDPF